MHHSKKIVVALLVTAVASLGIASPSSAQSVKGDNAGIMQIMKTHNWCC